MGNKSNCAATAEECLTKHDKGELLNHMNTTKDNLTLCVTFAKIRADSWAKQPSSVCVQFVAIGG
ncbi:MAG TPA: hypothetical protein DCP63_01230 [Bacteroidetes bacterium]|nr:hypothetical protein [Bacteroidota bacterium]